MFSIRFSWFDSFKSWLILLVIFERLESCFPVIVSPWQIIKLLSHFSEVAFAMFFGSVFGRFLTCFWLVFGVDFTCFSHPCSNCDFAYFFLGRFSNVCTLSKHGIFKTHCFSRVKTLFWRNRLCRQPMRKCISWDGIVPCLLLHFRDFWGSSW